MFTDKWQSPSARMRQFLTKWAKVAQQATLYREAGPIFPRTCDSCPARFSGDPNDALYRCCDCFCPAVECADCTLNSHRRNPFHRVDVWAPERGFWDRIPLSQVTTATNRKVVIELGHPLGVPCPTAVGRPSTRKMTIVHDHGINEYIVRFCGCDDSETQQPVPEPIQLIRFGLWPGSWKRPESAYTISALRDHQLLGLQAQMSTHDYVQYLRRTTDIVCPEDVPVRNFHDAATPRNHAYRAQDRYREFMTAAREFTFIRATKHAGIEPSEDLEPGVLTIRCPACPQPGVNMDVSERRPAGEE